MRIDFASAKRLLTFQDVLRICGWKHVREDRRNLRGPCPFHGSGPKSTSLSVDIQGKRFRCFKCEARGNHIDFAMQSAPQSGVYEVVVFLCQESGINVPYLED
jgi:DNA primase